MEKVPNSVESPIILFGTGRSGTTVFMNALLRHNELAFFSNILERKPEWLWLNYLRTLTDNSHFRLFADNNSLINNLILKPVEGYTIWDYVTGSNIDFSRSYLSNERVSENVRENIKHYLTDVMGIQKRPRFAMKITGPGRLFFLNQLFPDGHFIWLSRDFVPTLHSFLKVDFWQGRDRNELWWKDERVEGILENHPEVKHDRILFTAFQLQAIISDIRNSIQELGLNVMEIKYEDFTKDSNTVLYEVLKFCSLKEDPDCFKFLVTNPVENRNKKWSDYFNEEVISRIAEVREIVKKGFRDFK
jgi:hypothetical protein